MPGNGPPAPDPDRPTGRTRAGGWLLVLAGLLAIGEPLGLAAEVDRRLPSLSHRGTAVVLLVLVRVAVTGFGVAAGLAIFNRRPHAAGMATLALALLGGVSLFALLTPILPSNRLPGTTGPLAVAVVIYYVGWIAYLRCSRRVRETVG